MIKVMTPPSEPMTDGQIDKAVDHYRNTLRKHRAEIGSSDAVQRVLSQPEYLAEQLVVIRRRVEAMADLVVRHVKVNPTRTAQAVFDATGRKQYTDRKVVDAMPRGEGNEVVYFFKPRPEVYKNGFISDDCLEKEYEFHGFVPADPYSLAAVNEADPAFADDYPNVTHWKDAEGKWCYAIFDRWGDERGYRRGGYGWSDVWWFAGVRK